MLNAPVAVSIRMMPVKVRVLCALSLGGCTYDNALPCQRTLHRSTAVLLHSACALVLLRRCDRSAVALLQSMRCTCTCGAHRPPSTPCDACDAVSHVTLAHVRGWALVTTCGCWAYTPPCPQCWQACRRYSGEGALGALRAWGATPRGPGNPLELVGDRACCRGSGVHATQ
jgi:hypothetical protein